MRKGQMVASRLPEEMMHDLEIIQKVERSDRSTTVRKLLGRAIAEWKREYCAQQYGDSKMTMSRAAKEAGVSLWEMMDYIRQRKIAYQYDLEALRKDIETIEAGFGSERTGGAIE